MAAVMTVACGSSSEEEVLPSPPDPQPVTETPIAFSGSLSEEEKGSVTRSEPTGLETVLPDGNKKFRVWAYKNPASGGKQTVMDNYIVSWEANTAHTTTSNTHNWEYVNQGTAEQSIKYWDFSAAAYRFFGYTGSQNDVTVVNNAATVTIPVDASNETTIADIPYCSRLWFSNNDPDDYPDRLYGQAVTLEFLQPFARVRFMFTCAEGLDVDRSDLHNIRFMKTEKVENDNPRPIYTTGSVLISYPLTGSETKESWATYDIDRTNVISYFQIDYYELPDENTVVDPEHPLLYPNSPEKWYNVLPMKGPGDDGQGSFTLSVKVGGGGEPKTCVVPAEYMTWVPGYQYTYIFKILEGGEVSLDNVQVAIDDWTIKERVDHTVYNW